MMNPVIKSAYRIKKIDNKSKIFASAKFSLTRYGHYFDMLRGIIHTAYSGDGSIPPITCEIGKVNDKKAEDTACSNLDTFSRIFSPYFDYEGEEEIVSSVDRRLSIHAKDKYIAISIES